MTFVRSAVLAAFLAVAASGAAEAHDGVVHMGCPYGQVFSAGGVTVSGAFIPAVPKGAPTAAAYMNIAATGADTLTGATSLAGTITLHKMTQNGAVMGMTPLEGGLPLPAGGSVSLDAMTYHLMVAGMTQPFIAGQCVQMVLHFAKAGDLPIELNIGGMGSTTAPTGPPAGAASSVPMDMSAMSSMAM